VTVLRSRLDPASEESLANVERMTALVAELRDRTVAVAGRGARIFYNQARMSAAGIPEFKRYLGTGSKRASDVLANLARYGTVHESFEHEPSATELGRFLYRLNTMEVTTAYPALLWLLGPDGIEDPTERQVALTGTESWLVRRMLTRQTTKNYNTVFLALLNRVRDNSRTRGSRPTGATSSSIWRGSRGRVCTGRLLRAFVRHCGRCRHTWCFPGAGCEWSSRPWRRVCTAGSRRSGELEEVLEFPLPASCRSHVAHWHSHEGSAVARAILDAGWRAHHVDLNAQRVAMRRALEDPARRPAQP
jgi:hypothetical protein